MIGIYKDGEFTFTIGNITFTLVGHDRSETWQKLWCNVNVIRFINDLEKVCPYVQLSNHLNGVRPSDGYEDYIAWDIERNHPVMYASYECNDVALAGVIKFAHARAREIQELQQEVNDLDWYAFQHIELIADCLLPYSDSKTYRSMWDYAMDDLEAETVGELDFEWFMAINR